MSNTITGAKGITFSGETFIVPETHDMVKTLFDPTIKKSLFEMLIVAVLVINFGSVFFIADNSVRINCFIGFYIFWRFSYDFGIGYVLRQQSLHNLLVKWCKDHEIFDNNNKGFLSKILKFEIKSQMNKHYKISDYPIEFNTWLIFRRFVDLILMSDFINFIGLFIVCSMNNDFQAINFDQQNEWLVYFRLIFGSFLIIFNYWVKVNAHNTIKDYAWYWGDFFFRQINNEDLIFDGVFEMVPHPMYSVGYIGYYGFALISKSYTVLILACFGHFLQMVFLHFIENPHIDKIYGPSSNEIDVLKLVKLKDLKHFDNAKPMIGLWNFNILRGSDILNLINILTYSVILPSILYLINNNNIFLSFSISSYEVNIDSITFLFGLTIIIKLFESFSINILLILQSNYKSFTKYYLSNDIPVEKSLNNFAIIYNSFISLTYSSFFGLNFFIYLSGYNTRDLIFNDWFYLRNFIGILLIFTHVWINTSIIDSIGYFGWFYGDFFIPKSSLPHKANLTKAGVYRYLNNPEQIFGVCGIMGVFIIIPNFANLILCGLWVLNNFIRINCIEKFHMIKLYGEQEVLKDSGVTKTFKKHLIPEVIQRRLSNNHDDEIGERNDLLKQHRRKSSIVATATDTIDQIIKELKKSNTKLTKQNIYELSQNLYFENTDYKINVLNLNHSNEDDHNLLKYIEVGEPIKIGFKCPEVHSDKDWIGLYKIVQTSYSRYKTLISSNNRWHWVKPNETEGTLTFQKDELFWEEGIYEFRYHLDGKHDVAYISEPFEIKIPRFEVPNSSEDIYNFSKILKLEIFDKFIEIENINLPINEKFENADNFLRSYKTLAAVISTATNIKISEKIFLYNEDLSILKLSSKLVHMKKVLGELSNEIED